MSPDRDSQRAWFQFSEMALIWCAHHHGRRLVVGRLVRDGDSVRLYYDGPELGQAQAAGFEGYPGLPLSAAVHGPLPLETFTSRLPVAGRLELASAWAADALQDEPWQVLAATGGLTAADTLELIPRIEPLPGTYFRTDLAGHQFHAAAADVQRLRGTTLQLEPDPKNRFDAKAVVVRRGRSQLGYIKRVHNEAILATWEQGLRVSAVVEDVLREPFGPSHMVLIGIRLAAPE